jgi:hypothetical protein
MVQITGPSASCFSKLDSVAGGEGIGFTRGQLPLSDVSHTLSGIDHGNAEAAERLLPLVYDERSRLAAQRLAREPSGLTLQPTALVHVIKLRFFAGLTGDQASAALGVSPRAADSLWADARAWLFERMHPDGR